MRRCRNRSPESSSGTKNAMHKSVNVRWRRPIWLVFFASFLFIFLLYHSSHLLATHKKRLALFTQEFGYRIADSFVDHHKTDQHFNSVFETQEVEKPKIDEKTRVDDEEDSVSSEKDKESEEETAADNAVSKEESVDKREDDEKSGDGTEDSDIDHSVSNKTEEGIGKLAANDEKLNRTMTLANEKGSARDGNSSERVVDHVEKIDVGERIGGDEKQKQASVRDSDKVNKIDGDEKQKQSSVHKIDLGDEKQKQGSVHKIDVGYEKQKQGSVHKIDVRDEKQKKGYVQDIEEVDEIDVGDKKKKQGSVQDAEDVDKIDAGDEKQKQGSVQDAEDVDTIDSRDEKQKQSSVQDAEEVDKIDTGDEKQKQDTVQDAEDVDKIDTGDEKQKQSSVQDAEDVDKIDAGDEKQKQTSVQDVEEVDKIDVGDEKQKQSSVQDAENVDKIEVGDEKKKQGSIQDAENVEKIEVGDEKQKQGSIQDAENVDKTDVEDEKQKQGSVQNAEDVDKIDVGERVVDQLPVGGDMNQKQGSVKDAKDVEKIDAKDEKQKQKQDSNVDETDVGERVADQLSVGGDEKQKQDFVQDAEDVDKKNARKRVDEKPRQGFVEDSGIRENPKKEEHFDPVKRVSDENQNKVSVVTDKLAVDDVNANTKSGYGEDKVSKKESQLDHPIPKGIQNRAPTVKNNKQHPRNKKESCKGRYIYIHELPDRFNEDMIKNCHSLSKWLDMCQYIANFGLGPQLNNGAKEFSRGGWFATNQFTLEVIFHHRMKQYKCLTTDSSKASAIYLPYYAGLDVSRYLWYDKSLKDSASLDLVRWLREKKEWKRMWGRDHFFVAGRITWDFRREVENYKNWGNKLMLLPESKNMTILTIESSPWNRNDFGIPYPSYFHPKNDAEIRTWQSKVRRMKRRYLFCFAGAPRPNLHNSIRGEIIKQCQAAKRKCRLLECLSGNKCYQPTNVMKMFESSVFCLQPAGDSFTRRSTFDSILAGCIPVFFHPGSAYVQYIWHFPKDYNKYSIWIPGTDVKERKVNIEEFLENISRERVAAMREQLIRLIPKISYADPGFRLETHEDAFDIAVKGVLDKIERGRRDMQEGKNISFSFNEENAWKFYAYGTQRKREWDALFDRSKNKDLKNQ